MRTGTRARACVYGWRCAHSPSRHVPERQSSRTTEPAAGRSSASGRPEPPYIRTDGHRLPADHTDSRVNSELLGSTWLGSDSRPLLGSAQFGAVRLSPQGVRAAYTVCTEQPAAGWRVGPVTESKPQHPTQGLLVLPLQNKSLKSVHLITLGFSLQRLSSFTDLDTPMHTRTQKQHW